MGWTVIGALALLAALSTPALAEQGPSFDPDAATQAWMATIGSPAAARSNAYFEGGYWTKLASAAITIGACALMLKLGWARRARDWLSKVVKIRFFVAFGTAVFVTIVSGVMSLPFDYWARFARERAYGLSTKTFPGWAGDFGTAFGINLLISSLLIAVLYMVVRVAKSAWWIWGAGATVVIFAIVTVVAPVYILPRFNNYTPMAQSALRTDILQMAQANGVPIDNVYVFDASRQSNRVTANVSGFLGTTRIALADNLIARTSPEAVRAVAAHEVGHYVLAHTSSVLAMTGVFVTLLFAGVNWTFVRISRGERWGIRGPDDPAGLPLAIGLLAAIGAIVTPIDNTIARWREQQADIFGLNAGRAPDGFAEAALLFSEYRKLNPSPLEEWLFYDHPSGYARIHMAMHWKAREMAAGRYPPGPGGPVPGWRPDFAVENTLSPN